MLPLRAAGQSVTLIFVGERGIFHVAHVLTNGFCHHFVEIGVATQEFRFETDVLTQHVVDNEYLAYLCCILLPAKRFLFSRISLGYALLTLGFALIASPISSHLPLWLIPLMIGWGSAWVSASMLVRFVEHSEHCQRGTAQNTHLLIWSLSFAIGYLSASCCGW